MPVLDPNLTFRDFEEHTGYTGAHPLPRGNPGSGVHNLTKKDFRDAFSGLMADVNEALDNAGVINPELRDEAVAARDEAVAAADDAAAALAEMVALSGGAKQRTIASSPYVVRADDWMFEVTNYNAGVVEIDARALEYGRTYRFRCFALSTNSMKIDLGPDVLISGYQGFTGIELLFGQACQIVKSVDGIAYVTGDFSPVYRTMISANSWYQREENGEYTYFRRDTAAAGASSVNIPSAFKQKALANRVHVVGLVTNDPAATAAIVCRGFTDDATSLRYALWNPNAAATTYEITIGGLRTSTSALANTANHFRQEVPPLEDAVKLNRSYTIVTAGQSLADAYVNRSCYAGLDATLRAAGTLVNGTSGVGGTFLDVVNTAVGGTYADLQSCPAGSTAGYWYDSATNSNGPLLTDALADIAAAIGAGKTIQKIIFDLGQAESIRLGNGGAIKANVKEAFGAIIAALAAACPGTTELYLQLIVGREEAADTGTRIMREIQLELLASNPNVDGAIDHYDSELIDTVHPTDDAYYVVGQRMGRLFLGTYAPPVVSSAVKSGSVINVTLTGGIDLTRTPVNTVLDYVGIRTSGGAYYPVVATITGATSMTLTAKTGSGLTTLTTADQMLIPFDNSALAATTFAANAAGDLIRSAQVTVT